ncbi:MAG: YqgE/AlgH family protein [Alphaproteobacteria bacterium]
MSRTVWVLMLALGVFAGAASGQEPAAGSLTGKLLVAAEAMNDPQFDRTVIYLIEHGADGAMGLVVNVPMADVPLANLLPRLGVEEADASGEIGVFYGGPVEPGRAFMLHSSDVLFEGSIKVDDSVALTARPEIFGAISRGEGPQQSLFVLGYAGWAPGQLESELAREAWFVIPGEPALIFADDPAQSWARAMARRSVDL